MLTWEESVRQSRNFHPFLFYFEQKRRGEVSLGPGTNWLSRFWLVVLCGRRATINQAQPVLSRVWEALQVNGTERLINHHAQAARKVPGSEKQQERWPPSRPSGRDEASQTFLAPGVLLTFAQTETFQSLPHLLSPISLFLGTMPLTSQTRVYVLLCTENSGFSQCPEFSWNMSIAG